MLRGTNYIHINRIKRRQLNWFAKGYKNGSQYKDRKVENSQADI